ncbi:MAG TPA: site-2 protease family protein [Vicinamibacterales bacterium]|nr:site-2 protease family protein [Vicinamibacterales bacterium]
MHVLLFALTLATTTFIGAIHYLGFLDDFRNVVAPRLSWPLMVRGFWYSGTILAILGCHELGHYFACRYYDVDATLPFFLPAPPPFLTGTLGAVIRIREPFPGKRALFDIGIAGPIAGFLVTVPALFLGMALSHVARVPASFAGEELGEPLLFKLASWLFFGSIADGYSVNLHPMAFAAWFGMLATALNLFPIGQLDGGHISYSLLGRRSIYVTYGTIGVLIALTFFAGSWAFFALLTVMMLIVFGRHHPRVWDEDVPLDRTRLILAFVAAVIFVLCFTPAPITISDIIKR